MERAAAVRRDASAFYSLVLALGDCARYGGDMGFALALLTFVNALINVQSDVTRRRGLRQELLDDGLNDALLELERERGKDESSDSTGQHTGGLVAELSTQLQLFRIAQSRDQASVGGSSSVQAHDEVPLAIPEELPADVMAVRAFLSFRGALFVFFLG